MSASLVAELLETLVRVEAAATSPKPCHPVHLYLISDDLPLAVPDRERIAKELFALANKETPNDKVMLCMPRTYGKTMLVLIPKLVLALRLDEYHTEMGVRSQE